MDNLTKVVLPLSGGCDSAVLLFKAIREFDEVHCIIYDYNQRHFAEIACAVELVHAANKIARDLPIHEGEFKGPRAFYKIVDMKYIRYIAPTSSLTNDDIDTPDIRKIAGEAQPKSYVPFRNMMFLSTALSYAEAIGAEEVWHGATAVDSLAGYWDGCTSFVERLNALISLNRENQIRIKAPLINSNKGDIVRMGVSLCVPFNKTYTCYSGEELSDVTTPSSSLRVQGFIDAGYRDPIKYKQQAYLDGIYDSKGCKDIPYL